VRYQFIKDNTQNFRVSVMCRVLKVTRPAYYQWRKRLSTQRRIEEEKFTELVRKHYQINNGLYGLLKLVREIRKEGFCVNKKRIYRLMKKEGLYSRTSRKFKVTTKQGKGTRFSENLLVGKFQATRANEIWTSDITYIRTKEGWLYLAVVLDIYSRRIIGWAIQPRITSDIVLKALMMAITNRKPDKGIIFHSDRGSQYTSEIVRSRLNLYSFRQSMSGKGNCYDNAITETFFSLLKKELVYLTVFETREQARREVFEYIEIFYNRQRIHSSLGYLSPVEFEMKNREEFNSRVA
jgi:transposase InsO family protein